MGCSAQQRGRILHAHAGRLDRFAEASAVIVVTLDETERFFADAAAASPWVDQLHIAEIREKRLNEVASLTRPVTATADYRALPDNPSIAAVMISTTPEPTHYPIGQYLT